MGGGGGYLASSSRRPIGIWSGTVPTARKLGGWESLRKTIKTTQFGTRMPNGQWSAVTLLLSMAPIAPGAESGPETALKQLKNDSKQYQTPLGSLSTGLNPPSVTNNVSMERIGPWETQPGCV